LWFYGGREFEARQCRGVGTSILMDLSCQGKRGVSSGVVSC
jgi:hypothetical protein